MANYRALANESTVHVLTPTETVDVVKSTIQTHTSGVIAALLIAREEFDAGGAPARLSYFASNIEQVMQTGLVSGASGGQSIDDNNLLQQVIDFTVSYTPPGGLSGPLTAQVEVPASSFQSEEPAADNPVLQAAIDLIRETHARLVALAGN